jgi:hypothetical protein
MDGGWALVVSAVVTAVGGLLVAMLSRFRKENKQDHDIVLGLLKMVYSRAGRVEEKVDKVDERLTQHVGSHSHGGAE